MGIIATLVHALATAGILGATDPARPCTFQVTPAAVAQIVAPPDLVPRVRVMAQPDSPVAIVRVDLGGFRLVGGPGWFERTGQHVVEVKNVSDQVITDAEVVVHVGFAHNSGVGSGSKLPAPLNPGEQARIEWKAGAGRGSASSVNSEAVVVAFVSRARTSSCTYKPSQSWPSSADAGPH